MFEPERQYRRRDLHEVYGGQRQGGISTPSDAPIIFLFSGAGQQYGYRDGFDDAGRLFRYSGEGQRGDMHFVRGNAAIRDHADTGRDLHVFEADGAGFARYVGQMVYAGHELVPNTPDVDGHIRTSIVFHLVPIEGADPRATSPADVAEALLSADDAPRLPDLWTSPMATVLEAALARADQAPTARDGRRIVRTRSEAVRVYVQRRANGRCEGCGSPAPFQTVEARPYLEPHHIRRLSDGGPDHPGWVIALCPNCHRRVHHGADGSDYNHQLMAAMTRLMA